MPGRSLVEFSAATNEEGELMLSCFCDCGATTTVVLAGPPPKTDFAFTCEGCGSVHWMAVKEMGTDD